MKKFKIISPGGYSVSDVLNENIDINVILEDEVVYFATCFTPLNIETLLLKEEKEVYFWATDMLIVKDLKKSTIREAVSQIIEDDLTEKILCRIGTIKTVYPSWPELTFDNIDNILIEESV